MFRLQKNYLWAAIVLLLIETGIALFLDDAIIRPHVGDVLVVILIYCFVKAFIDIKPTMLALGVFVFACFVEFLQYLKIVEWLGLQHIALARIVIGTTFTWIDILCYAIGIIIILLFERSRSQGSLVKLPANPAK